ncbi:MAG: ABC transporter substrate-binding protein [Campylobacterota bacterium]|nr:ABC transporter substrate-binding protein [Campylobacterota bacterium]
MLKKIWIPFLIVFGFLIYNIIVIEDNQIKKSVAFITLSEVDNETFKGFKNGMETLGWREGSNIEYIVPKVAHTIDKLDSIVEEVLYKEPDLIFVSSTPATQAVKKALNGKKNIPVVFCPVNNPMSAGILKNMISPEGVFTGIRPPASDMKRFEWLMTLLPNTKNIIIPFTPQDDSSLSSRKDIIKASKEYDVNITQIAWGDDLTIKQFLDSINNMKIDSILLPRDSKVEVEIEEFSKFTIKNRLSLCVPSYQQVQKGALFAFGFIHFELGYEASQYAHKILKGVSVSDLPVKFGDAHLVLNKRVADKIGVEFSENTETYAKKIFK